MSFEDLGLMPRLLTKLNELGLTDPTPIQTQAIPHVMAGRDVMGLAQTGTGKTAAFGLPMLQMLIKAGTKPEPKSVRGLILAPTRELAKQIQMSLQPFTQGTHLKIGLVVGGASINAQINRAFKGTDLMVATPGRLIDLLDRKAIRLDQAQFLVLDEADQMLDMGFIAALRRIAPLLPKSRQTMLFSATMPKLMAELSASYLTDPVRVQVSPPGKAADKVEQEIHFVQQAEKGRMLIQHLGKHENERALVFCRTKHGAEKLKKTLEKQGFAAGSIHGNKSQGQRDRAIKEFKDGTLTVLVATDVAARGLDIPGVMFVYNYDMPNVPDNYVHRIGRTARAGADGFAIAYCSPTEMGELKAVEKTMGRAIPVASGEAWEPEKKPQRGGPGGGHKGGGGRGRGGPKPGGAPKPAGGNRPRRNRRRSKPKMAA